LTSRPDPEVLIGRARERTHRTGSRLAAERILAHRDHDRPVILVVDASVLVAALVDSGPDGAWAAAVLGDHELAAPHLMPIEAADILRRAALAGDITADSASLAHGDVLDLLVELWPYAHLAERCWQLRENVTTG
jgi:predicted nucleic acid-binding protein